MKAPLAVLLEVFQAAAAFGQTPVSCSPAVSPTSVAFPIATDQVASLFCALPPAGLIARNSVQLTPQSLGQPSWALSPTCSFCGSALSAKGMDNIGIIQFRQLTMGRRKGTWKEESKSLKRNSKR